MKSPIAACVISRRTTGVSVFSDNRLEYTRAKQLPSDLRKAEQSIAALIHHIADHFSPTTLAVTFAVSSARNGALMQMAMLAARERAMTVWKVESAELLAAFAQPPLTSKSRLRDTVRSIWPILNERSTDGPVLDAVALGLYCHFEQLFRRAESLRSS
jgi:hypothetical protein